ncbi:tail fiber domain-containing protein [Enterocloster aldenensis]|uniref:tail fiber domain-containing protein n=1 Tax=Enterocloster aldenensis TaxID=358742 RepID=UPI004024C2A0
MSSFNMPAPGGRNQDVKKVYSYIQMLNKQLIYSLRSITPEDNFTQETFLKYQETDTNIAQLEMTMNGFLSQFRDLEEELETSIRVLNGEIALKVSVGDLCSEISATTDTIMFKSGYLVIDSNNFKLYKDGTAVFSGTINGGSININDSFIVSSSGAVTTKAITYSGRINVNGLLYSNYMRIAGDANIEGSLSCRYMNASYDVSCEVLFERSDRRLKEDIEEIPDDLALEIVLGYRPVTFTYKDSGKKGMGLVAQELEELQDRLGTDLPMVEHSGEYLSIPYGTNSVLYAGAIRAQQKELDKLETEIRKLEEHA